MTDNPVSGKPRLNYLDFYKGVCMLLIIFTHYVGGETGTKLFFPFWVDMAVPILMVITGYLNAMSFERTGSSLRTAYAPKEIIRKMVRFLIPFLTVFIIELVVKAAFLPGKMSIGGVLLSLVSGGYGPGSYFTPVMVQVVIMIPVICFVVRKYKHSGLIGCFAVNVLYEVFKTLIGMNADLYRLCALRYVFILGYGCYLYFAQKTSDKKHYYWYYLAGIAGTAYIILFNYTGIRPMITGLWKTTCVFSVLYIVPVMMYLMRPNHIRNKVIELIGKASFNVFLAQMCYYWIAAEKVYGIVGRSQLLRLAVNIVICSAAGVVFYLIEYPVTRRIMSMLRKKP